MPQPVIAATGIYVPPNSISNAELVGAFNAYVERFNADNATAIAAGEIAPLLPSSVEFIEKASGIKSRYVMDKQGILDPAIMRPMHSRAAQRANLDPRRDGCRGGRGCARKLGRKCRRHRRGDLRSVEYAASLSRHVGRSSERSWHRRLCVRHECRLLVGDVRHQDRRRLHLRRLGQGGPDGQSRNLLGPSELHATATVTSFSATSRRRDRLPKTSSRRTAGTSSARGSRPSSPTTSATISAFSIAPRPKASAARTSFSCRRAARSTARSYRWCAN